jgi:hypothetical protein
MICDKKKKELTFTDDQKCQQNKNLIRLKNWQVFFSSLNYMLVNDGIKKRSWCSPSMNEIICC